MLSIESDQLVAMLSASMSFIGLLLVVVQIRHSSRQRSLESLSQVYDINRELLSLGFSHPQLFKILLDDNNVDPQWERRYLQLWLNQLSLIHTFLRQGGFNGEFQESLKSEISDFMCLHNMRRHWQARGSFYPVSFQKLVDGIITKLPSIAETMKSS